MSSMVQSAGGKKTKKSMLKPSGQVCPSLYPAANCQVRRLVVGQEREREARGGRRGKEKR